jgi:hypothetical protein
LVEPTPSSFVHSVSLFALVGPLFFTLVGPLFFALVGPLFSPTSCHCLCLILFCLVRLESCRSVRRWSGLSGPSLGLERPESVGVLGCLPWRGVPINCAVSWPQDGTVKELLFGFRCVPRRARPLFQRGRPVLPDPAGFVWTISPFCLVERPICLCLRRAVVLPPSGRSLCLILSPRFISLFAYVGPLFCLRQAVVFPLFLFRSVGDRMEKSCSVRRWSGLSGPSLGLEWWESVGVLGCGWGDYRLRRLLAPRRGQL